MKTFPALKGFVRRRILVNFRIDPAVVEPILPAPFQPKLVDGWAMAGICLIRLEQVRPRGCPAVLGTTSENAAHRMAVTWHDEQGNEREGVYIPRRDTGSRLNATAGGRVFPGEHHHSRFRIHEDLTGIDLKLESDDGEADVWLRARPATHLPSSSCFASLQEASDFFAGGAVGYSATLDGTGVDGLLLRTDRWRVEPLDVDWVISSYYADRSRFPAGSVEYDCTLVMRALHHEWVPQPPPCASVAEQTVLRGRMGPDRTVPELAGEIHGQQRLKTLAPQRPLERCKTVASKEASGPARMLAVPASDRGRPERLA
jgi:hypothetical protein